MTAADSALPGSSESVRRYNSPRTTPSSNAIGISAPAPRELSSAKATARMRQSETSGKKIRFTGILDLAGQQDVNATLAGLLLPGPGKIPSMIDSLGG